MAFHEYTTGTTAILRGFVDGMTKCHEHDCDRQAEGWLLAPVDDGTRHEPVPGGHVCQHCAVGAITEYRAKLDQRWLFVPGWVQADACNNIRTLRAQFFAVTVSVGGIGETFGPRPDAKAAAQAAVDGLKERGLEPAFIATFQAFAGHGDSEREEREQWAHSPSCHEIAESGRARDVADLACELAERHGIKRLTGGNAEAAATTMESVYVTAHEAATENPPTLTDHVT